MFSIVSCAKTLLPNKFTFTDSRWSYLLGSTIPPAKILVQGIERYQRREWFSVFRRGWQWCLRKGERG